MCAGDVERAAVGDVVDAVVDVQRPRYVAELGVGSDVAALDAAVGPGVVLVDVAEQTVG